MTRNYWRPALVLTAATLAGAMLGAGTQLRAQSKPTTDTVRIANIPVANYTPMIVARDKGWFEEERLAVSWSAISQGAVAVEAVFGGSAEIGGSSIFEPMVARGNG